MENNGIFIIKDGIFIGLQGNTDYYESITIPDSVTRIGRYAFADCKSLKNITIPDSVTVLQELMNVLLQIVKVLKI